MIIQLFWFFFGEETQELQLLKQTRRDIWRQCLKSVHDFTRKGLAYLMLCQRLGMFLLTLRLLVDLYIFQRRAQLLRTLVSKLGQEQVRELDQDISPSSSCKAR
jgi:hypothetical protein